MRKLTTDSENHLLLHELGHGDIQEVSNLMIFSNKN